MSASPCDLTAAQSLPQSGLHALADAQGRRPLALGKPALGAPGAPLLRALLCCLPWGSALV